MIYQIWVEGYQATGQYGHAQLITSESGETFVDACNQAYEKGKFNGYGSYSTSGARPTLWGCRLFDNESDARKSFG